MIQNYKDTVDPAVIVNFPLDEDSNVKVIAWTTTPWTLPSNLALCVNPSMTYVKVKISNVKKLVDFVFVAESSFNSHVTTIYSKIQLVSHFK